MKFKQVIELNAVKFDPDVFPWHRSVQRVTVDGKIPDFEAYNCIIPCDRVVSIKPGNWIVVDDMNNAKFVLDEITAKMMNITPVFEPQIDLAVERGNGTVELLKVTTCSTCKGTGVDPEQDSGLTKICRRCQGVGKQRLSMGAQIEEKSCATCFYEVANTCDHPMDSPCGSPYWGQWKPKLGATKANKINGELYKLCDGLRADLQDFANFLDVDITYYNHGNWEKLLITKKDGTQGFIRARGTACNGGYFGYGDRTI